MHKFCTSQRSVIEELMAIGTDYYGKGNMQE